MLHQQLSVYLVVVCVIYSAVCYVFADPLREQYIIVPRTKCLVGGYFSGKFAPGGGNRRGGLVGLWQIWKHSNSEHCSPAGVSNDDQLEAFQRPRKYPFSRMSLTRPRDLCLQEARSVFTHYTFTVLRGRLFFILLRACSECLS